MTPERRSDLAVAVAGGLAFGAVLASYSAFRPVRDARTLGGDADNIKWLFMATFVAMAIISPLWSALLARVGRRRCVPAALQGFVACLIGFAILTALHVSPIIVGRVFYVWSAVFSLFAVSVLWSLLADLLGVERARRLYGPIAAGGSLGAIAGPAATRALVEHVGIAGILVMSAILLELGILAILAVRRLAGEPRAAEPAPLAGHAFTGLARVARTPYLAAIVGYVLCTATAATFMYLQQGAIARHALPDELERTKLFATIEILTNGGTFLVQSLITARVLARVGPGIVLLALPIAQELGVSAVVTMPTLAVLVTAQVTTRVLTHGFTRPARELLFTVVDASDKYRAKNAIDTVGYRFGDLASSWVHDGLRAIAASGALLVWAMLPLAAIWIALALALGIGFSRRYDRAKDLKELTA